MSKYKTGLEKAVKEFQPLVENLFGVSLGIINLEPLFDVDVQDAQAQVIPIRPKVIKYNSSPSLNDLPPFAIDYIAIHEMAHMADFILSPLGTRPLRDSYVDESIANYASHKILGLFVNPKKLEEVKISKEHTKQAIFLRSRLNKFGVSLKDYVENFNRIENIWGDFEGIRV